MNKNYRRKQLLALMLSATMIFGQTVAFTASSTSEPITRTKAAEQYKWNLKEIYPNRAAFEKDMSDLKKTMIPKLITFKGKLKNPEDFKTFMALDEEVSRKLMKAYVYAQFSIDLDQTSGAADEMINLANAIYGAYSEATSFVSTELTLLSNEEFDVLMTTENLKLYKRYLDKIKRVKPHVLSEKEEALLSKGSEFFGSPSKIFDKVTVADYKDPIITDKKGKKIELTDANYNKIIEGTDRDLRKKAFEAMTASYKDQINTLSANYIAEVQKNIFLSRTKNYKSALDAALFNEEVPRSIYDNLVKAVNGNLKYMHQYNAVKKNYFGLKEMYSYDAYVPVTSTVNTNYTFDGSVKIISKALAPLGTQYVSDFNSAIKNRWVDAYPDTNKTEGGYQWGAYDTHPYILMNFDNTLDSALTLAHEMGHALNSSYSNKKQPYITSDYPIFTAEVASTVNELLVMDYLIKNSKSKDEKLFLINQQIQNIRGTMYSQVMYAEFEKTIHDKVEKGDPISSDVLNSTWLTLLKKYNGKDMTILNNQQYSWSRISHFYMNFYVYKYATSMSAAYSIVNQIKTGDQAAVDRYLTFLSAGGEKDPIATLKDAGVDMNSTKPVDDLLKYFGQLVTEYEKLLKEKKAAPKKAS